MVTLGGFPDTPKHTAQAAPATPTAEAKTGTAPKRKSTVEDRTIKVFAPKTPAAPSEIPQPPANRTRDQVAAADTVVNTADQAHH